MFAARLLLTAAAAGLVGAAPLSGAALNRTVHRHNFVTKIDVRPHLIRTPDAVKRRLPPLLANGTALRNVDWTDCSTPGSLVSLDDVDVEPPFASGVTSLVSLRGTQNEEISWPGTQVISIFYLGIRLETLEAPLCDPEDPEPCPYTGAGPLDVSFEFPMFEGPPGPYRVDYEAFSAEDELITCVELGFSL